MLAPNKGANGAPEVVRFLQDRFTTAKLNTVNENITVISPKQY